MAGAGADRGPFGVVGRGRLCLGEALRAVACAGRSNRAVHLVRVRLLRGPGVRRSGRCRVSFRWSVFLQPSRIAFDATRGHGRLLPRGAFVFRFHLAPALALAALWYCRIDVRQRWLPLLAGASLPLLALGLADWIAWSQPFASVLNNFRANILEGRSHVYGTSGAGWYVSQLAQQWSFLFPAVLLLAAWGARREPLALITALAIVLVHSVVAHKEYRFIYPALLLVVFWRRWARQNCCAGFSKVTKQAALSHGDAGRGCTAWLAASMALAARPRCGRNGPAAARASS